MILLNTYDMPNAGQALHQTYIFGYIVCFLVHLFSRALEKLEHKVKPLLLTSKENIIMVVSYILVGLLAQYIGFWAVIGQDSYIKLTIDSTQPLNLSSENNTVNFLICSIMQVICGLLVYQGPPLK